MVLPPALGTRLKIKIMLEESLKARVRCLPHMQAAAVIEIGEGRGDYRERHIPILLLHPKISWMLMLMITLLLLGFLLRRRPGNRTTSQVFASALECTRTEKLQLQVMRYPEGPGPWRNHWFQRQGAAMLLTLHHQQRRLDMVPVREAGQETIHHHHIYKDAEMMVMEGESMKWSRTCHIRWIGARSAYRFLRPFRCAD